MASESQQPMRAFVGLRLAEPLPTLLWTVPQQPEWERIVLSGASSLWFLCGSCSERRWLLQAEVRFCFHLRISRQLRPSTREPKSADSLRDTHSAHAVA